MAKHKTILVGAINIKAHPHNDDIYISLFKDIYASGRIVKIRGHEHGTIGYLSTTEQNSRSMLYGAFYKFLQIDPNADWLDLIKREPIPVEKDQRIPIIPEHLKPNLKQILFLFDIKMHRLFFDTKQISPYLLTSTINSLFHTQPIIDKYNKIDVHLESSTEAIRRILSIPHITRLNINITIPNADDLSDKEQAILEKIKKQRGRRMDTILTSNKADGLLPDEETITLMNVAKSNGAVWASGYDASNNRITQSTEFHPTTTHMQYNPKETTELEALRIGAEKFTLEHFV